MGVRVLATGSYVPDRIVTNEDLKAAHGFDPDWIVQRTGIRERRVSPPELATSDLAIRAARRCIERAELDPGNIDLLIVATFTADRPLPSCACVVQEALGLRCPAMDIQAACAGFMYAMVTAMQYIASGCSRAALVIGAETISRVINPADQRTFPLFGDGAGAALLGPGSPEQGFLAYTLGADGSGAELIKQQMGGSRLPPSCAAIQSNLQFMEMDGRPVFKWAIRLIYDTIHDVIEHAGVPLGDIRLFLPHQANVRIIDAAAENLGIDRSRVFVNLDRYGNTSAGSIPLALDEACVQGRIRRGDLLMFSGFGAGLTWGTALMRW
jgi:3-oxoacyl-[acyl-carrier-protein] synthase-3